ncbi:MAG TPA: hypothetical protein VLC98_16695 [Phnomibacter sp.]|nr:hypothetical protein [Phnomibacter sp.]
MRTKLMLGVIFKTPKFTPLLFIGMTYPYTKYPELVEKYRNNVFPEFELLKIPSSPRLKKHSYYEIMLSFSLILLAIILNSLNVGSLLIYLILLGISIYLIYESIKFRKVVNQQNALLRVQYANEILAIEEENKKRKKLKENFINSDKYKKGQILKVLQGYEKGSIITKVAKKGISESFFFRCLYSHFSKHIKQCYILYGNRDLIPAQPDYTPDFVFENENIVIDIEVDEPYIIDSKTPIHLSDDKKNEIRDNVFISKNWCVIRFAEVQVLLQPFECCKYIAEVIFDLTGENTYKNKLSHYREVEPVNFWNLIESREMAKSNFRENAILKANHYASQLEYFPKNNFVNEDSCILTKTGETKLKLKDAEIEQEYILCYNNSSINSHEVLILKRDFPKIEEGETFDINLKEFILTDEFQIHLLPKGYFNKYGDFIDRGYDEYKQPLIRLEKVKHFLSITQIKEKLNIPELKMYRDFDEEGNKKEWLFHWDIEKKIRVIMHETVCDKIKRDKQIQTLELSDPETLKNKQGENYVLYIVYENSKDIP